MRWMPGSSGWDIFIAGTLRTARKFIAKFRQLLLRTNSSRYDPAAQRSDASVISAADFSYHRCESSLILG